MILTRVIHRPQLDQLLEDFDFDNAARVYAALDWRWGGSRNTPSADELRDLATVIIHDLLEIVREEPGSDYYHVTSGGLNAEMLRMDDGWEYRLILEAVRSTSNLPDDGWGDDPDDDDEDDE